MLGVPIPATLLNGLDSLLSIVQMPKGVPVGTLAIGEPGAINAALLATAIVSTSRADVRERLRAWRQKRTDDVLANTTITLADADGDRFLPVRRSAFSAADSSVA